MKKTVCSSLFACTLLLLSSTECLAQSATNPTREIEPYLDLNFTTAERDSLYRNLQDYQRLVTSLHAHSLPNSVGMSLLFNPRPSGFIGEPKQLPVDFGIPRSGEVPKTSTELAFLPVYKLSALIRGRKITSVQLTQLYLERLRKYSDTLQCTITLLETTALASARLADEEIARGKYRGPLHGIPYGIKDLLAVEGTKTTWGAAPYKGQQLDVTATVVNKLNAAGAVLIVKLTMCPGPRRHLVRRCNKESLGPQPGIQRVLRGISIRHGCRTCSFCHRNRNAGLDCVALHAVRHHRVAPFLRAGEPPRGYGAQLEHGQDWSHLPKRAGLRDRI